MFKYDTLADWLSSHSGPQVGITLADVDALVSGLPPSARTDRTWWGNTSNRTRVQAYAWLGAGWRVEDVDFTKERVTFVRTESRRTRG